MSSETADLRLSDRRYFGSEPSSKMSRFSSSQIENLLHIQAILVAYFYRFDGETTQYLDVYTPCLLSTSRRASTISLAVKVCGSTTLGEIKDELTEHFSNVLSGLTSISPASNQDRKLLPGDKSLVFYDVGYPIENWLDKNLLSDITVLCEVSDENMVVSFRSRFESLDEETLESLSKHFLKFAESEEFAGNQISVADICLNAIEDIELNTETYLASEAYPEFQFPHKIFENISYEFPCRMAMEFNGQRINYETLNKSANQIAHFLESLGVAKGKRCVVLIKPSFDTISVMLAIFKVGAVYVPVDYEYPPERIKYVIQDSNPAAILCIAETATLLDPDDRIINLDEFGTTRSEMPSTNLQESVLPEDDAYVFYTSGTTGKPKGVMGTYRNLFHYVSVAKAKFDMGADTIMPVVAKTSFSISFFETMTPLISGGACVLLPRADVLDVNRMIDVLRRVTMFHIGPSLLARIIRKIKQDDAFANFPNILHASTGGDMVPVELLHDMSKLFAGAEVYVIYGSSEIACMGCTYPVSHRELPAKTLVGKAFPGMQVEVVDADMNVLPVGWKGEICFIGDGVTRGYQNNSELTREKFFERGHKRGYRTGDVGRLDSDGNIEMLGRSDFQVKINGIRVELAEVDYYLKKSPHVAEIISKASRTEDGSIVIYACVVGELSRQQIGDIRKFLSNNIPEYMHPKGFIRIDNLPLNHNLKVDRKALPDPTVDNLIRESDYVAAETETERRLTKIWEDILGISPIGVNDDFFNSGGTSLQGVDLLVAIEEQLKSTISVNCFMQARTIRSLARHIDGAKLPFENSESTIALKKGEAEKTIFFIHDGEGDLLPYLSLAQSLDENWSAFGIAPRAQGYAKTVHTTFESMIEFYVSEIIRIKPEHPFLLAGLCVGGFLAYCVGCKLQDMGEQISHIVLFDSHYIDAKPIKGREHLQRSQRLKEAIASADNNSTVSRLIKTAKIVSAKGRRYLTYKINLHVQHLKNSLQLFLLANSAVDGAVMRRFAPSVDSVIRNAESRYTARPRFHGDVTLFRATKRLHLLDGLNIDDTPYQEIFEDEGLGWPGKFEGKLKIHDILAGHSTLLTPPYVNEISKEICRFTSIRDTGLTA